MTDALEWVAGTLTTRGSAGDQSVPDLLFLVREYAAHGSGEVRDALEAGLTAGLDRVEADPCARLEWIGVCAEAVAVADDERLVACVQEGLAPAIEALEQFVRDTYEPGEGLVGRSLADHIRCGNTLVTAFDLTGRLPYSMLAEELLLVARRAAWDEQSGAFRGNFAVNCGAARLVCRIVALHRDAEYTAAAVVADHSGYARDAERTLAFLASVYRDHPTDAGEYGVALLDWFALTRHPN